MLEDPGQEDYDKDIGAYMEEMEYPGKLLTCHF